MRAAIRSALASVEAPQPKKLTDWFAEDLQLSAEDSAEPGGYTFDRAPFQRGILEAIDDPNIRQIVLEASSQVGKTLIVKGAIGHTIDQDPCPILFVTYSLDMTETFSKDRFDTMCRDTKCLTGKVKDATSRDSGNTTKHKKFPGGHITFVGANAPGGLSSRPVRWVFLDEVDRYPLSSGKEGDPVRLAITRSRTFYNRKALLVSSPTDEETSRIHRAYLASDQRRYYVPCPHCGHSQTLKWGQVKWLPDQPNSAAYLCEAEGCGALWSNAEKNFAVRCGKWIAAHPERKVAGFHISELYASFRTLTEIVEDFLEAKKTPETLKTFVNTTLAEVWQDREGDKVDADDLAKRVENYTPETIPERAVLVTLGVDVQDDRLAFEFVAWGPGEESWSVDYLEIFGDPGRAKLWEDADDQLARIFRREDGAALAVTAAGIDTAGHYTKQAYAWCKKHKGRGVFALVGRGGKGRPIVVSGKKPIKVHRIKLHTAGVDTLKELLLMSRIRVKAAGPGYCHFPARYAMTAPAYFTGITAEKRVVAYSKGQPVHRWELITGRRNEPLDCRNYATVALTLINPNFEALAERVESAKPEKEPEPTPTPAQRAEESQQTGTLRRSTPGGWMARRR